MDEQKAFAVRVEGYSSLAFFDHWQNVVWYMQLCDEEGYSYSVYSRNELGQYERFAYYENEEED